MGPGNLQIELKSVRPSDDDDAGLNFCLAELSRFPDHPSGILSDETRKWTSKKWLAPVMWPRTMSNMGPEADLDWFRKAFEISQTGCCGGRPR